MAQVARFSSGSDVVGGYPGGRVGMRGMAALSRGQVEGLKGHDGLLLNDAEYQFQFLEDKNENRTGKDRNFRRRAGLLFQTPSVTFAAMVGGNEENEGAAGGGGRLSAFGGLLNRAISAYEKTASVVSAAAAGPNHTVWMSL